MPEHPTKRMATNENFLPVQHTDYVVFQTEMKTPYLTMILVAVVLIVIGVYIFASRNWMTEKRMGRITTFIRCLGVVISTVLLVHSIYVLMPAAMHGEFALAAGGLLTPLLVSIPLIVPWRAVRKKMLQIILYAWLWLVVIFSLFMVCSLEMFPFPKDMGLEMPQSVLYFASAFFVIAALHLPLMRRMFFSRKKEA